jgi:flagellar biosynthesis chaperone FliJ
MIKKFEEFIIEREILSIFDECISINESRKGAKHMVELAKKEVKKWDKDILKADEEYKNAIANKKLMSSDIEKYSKEVNDKLNKLKEVIDNQDKKSYYISYIICLISNIKDQQTMLFKYGSKALENLIKNNKDAEAFETTFKNKFPEPMIQTMFSNMVQNSISDQKKINVDTFYKYIDFLIGSISKDIDKTCEVINNYLDKIEKLSEVSDVVFGDSKIPNKERINSKEFTTIYHKDIADFVKDYKLIGIEYDKRIELVDKNEIFKRFYKKINKTFKENNI